MKKRALLVGINYAGTSNALKGCINDSHNMQAFLAANGFDEIKLVLEKEATTDGIKAGMEWLIAGAQPGDVLLMHYSGHGSQLLSETEADGFEEIICPYDLNWMDKVITDDTLRTTFNKVPNGVNTTLILDCCHSGTMLDQTESLLATKEVNAPAAPAPKTKKAKKGSRYMKPPAAMVKKLKDRKLVDWSTSRDVNATALLIAGCQANQTSADAFIDGQAQGAATAALLKFAKANSSISYKSLVTNMNDYMVANKFTQRPQLDGSSSLYDQTFLQPFSFSVPVDTVVPADEPTAQPPENNSDSDSDSDSNKKMLAIVAVAVIIALIVFLA